MRINPVNKKICIIGAGGFIGTNLIHRLEEYDLTLFNRSDIKHDKRHHFIKASFDNINLLKQAIESCKVVILLAPYIGDHGQISQFINICVDNGIEKCIFASSGGTIYGHSDDKLIAEHHNCQPLSSYGKEKLLFEEMLRESGLDYLSLRISNPYGPYQTGESGQGIIAVLMKALLNNRAVPIYGNGEMIRDYIYIDDVMDVFEKSLAYKDSENTMNIGSGIGRSINQLAANIETVTQKKLILDHKPGRENDVKSNILDIRLAEKELNWRPATAWMDGLERTWQWISSQQ